MSHGWLHPSTTFCESVKNLGIRAEAGSKCLSQKSSAYNSAPSEVWHRLGKVPPAIRPTQRWVAAAPAKTSLTALRADSLINV